MCCRACDGYKMTESYDGEASGRDDAVRSWGGIRDATGMGHEHAEVRDRGAREKRLVKEAQKLRKGSAQSGRPACMRCGHGDVVGCLLDIGGTSGLVDARLNAAAELHARSNCGSRMS